MRLCYEYAMYYMYIMRAWILITFCRYSDINLDQMFLNIFQMLLGHNKKHAQKMIPSFQIVRLCYEFARCKISWQKGPKVGKSLVWGRAVLNYLYKCPSLIKNQSTQWNWMEKWTLSLTSSTPAKPSDNRNSKTLNTNKGRLKTTSKILKKPATSI